LQVIAAEALPPPPPPQQQTNKQNLLENQQQQQKQRRQADVRVCQMERERIYWLVMCAAFRRLTTEPKIGIMFA